MHAPKGREILHLKRDTEMSWKIKELLKLVTLLSHPCSRKPSSTKGSYSLTLAIVPITMSLSVKRLVYGLDNHGIALRLQVWAHGSFPPILPTTAVGTNHFHIHTISAILPQRLKRP